MPTCLYDFTQTKRLVEMFVYRPSRIKITEEYFYKVETISEPIQSIAKPKAKFSLDVSDLGVATPLPIIVVIPDKPTNLSEGFGKEVTKVKSLFKSLPISRSTHICHLNHVTAQFQKLFAEDIHSKADSELLTSKVSQASRIQSDDLNELFNNPAIWS